MSAVETPAIVVLDDLLPTRPTPPADEVLGLDDVRTRVIRYAARMGGGVWVLTSQQRFQSTHDLIGLYDDAGDALRDMDDEIENEHLPKSEPVTADEIHEAAWEITVGTVILRLAWDTVLPRQGGQR